MVNTIVSNQDTEILFNKLFDQAGQAQARQSVDYNYQQLDWDFVNAMARIGHYGGQKYGIGSWKVKALTGDADPINHAFEHIKAFIQNEGHDKFEDNRMNLAAAAYNLMMAFFYAKPIDIPK